MALLALHNASRVHYVISQNVDGLHLRSGLPRGALSELHGNLFVEWCPRCRRENMLHTQTESVGMKPTGTTCHCGTPMTDKALDWDDVLPEPDFQLANTHSASADLNIVVGTSCQMEPARSLPFRAKHGKNSRAIVNLSHTDFDHRFGICIRARSDTVFAIVAAELAVSIPPYEKLTNLILSVTWVHRGVQCNVFPKQSSAPERLRVRYRCVGAQAHHAEWTHPLSSFPFQHTLRTEGRHIEAQLTCGREKVLLAAVAVPNKATQTEARIVVERKEWMQHSSNTIQQLKERIKQQQHTPINPLTLSTGLSRVRVVGGVYAVCVRNKYGAVKISSLTTSSTASPHTNFGSALLPLSSDQHLLCHLFIIQTRRSTYRTASTGNNVSEGLCWKTPAG
ncbi:NAD-dependent protein deacetylase SRT1 [Gracilariopsis chorda]|uniref:protein acetyllysine N-acetyltransferase n=1 Tax=Gracilariopsis chorda TaxID=448386 RepID=A0A2V3IJ73_9FLOR|nr:NAD-dependent protein deacetylase SRT1 [Gracilariopsis chorda]|eukprot:PXF42083.1 NAD-dependent protein deacetylase SRT1 [Gracilariopsis chorda]